MIPNPNFRLFNTILTLIMVTLFPCTDTLAPALLMSLVFLTDHLDKHLVEFPPEDSVFTFSSESEIEGEVELSVEPKSTTITRKTRAKGKERKSKVEGVVPGVHEFPRVGEQCMVM